MEQYPQFYSLSERRYSCRGYSDKSVPRDLIVAAFDAMRLVIDTPELCQAIRKSYDREWFNSAPVYVVALGLHDEAWHRPYDGKDHTDVDVSIAVEHFCLAASTLGLGTCWVCNFDPAVLNEALSLPEGVEPIAIIPLGYPIDGSQIPEKKRKSLDEIVKWGKY